MTNDPRGRNDDVQEQFSALLDGLRTTLPGVQLTTAFLLTLPLYDKFAELARGERVAYYVAFVCSLLASLLFMAPSAHQRLRADHGIGRRSQHHLDVAVRITVVGTVAFAVAIVSVSFLVSSVVLGTGAAGAVTGVIAAVCLWSWFYLPLLAFEDDDP
ncbi:MAG: DUF6328 family protein [Acidimicrobiales bacterium]